MAHQRDNALHCTGTQRNDVSDAIRSNRGSWGQSFPPSCPSWLGHQKSVKNWLIDCLPTRLTYSRSSYHLIYEELQSQIYDHTQKKGWWFELNSDYLIISQIPETTRSYKYKHADLRNGMKRNAMEQKGMEGIEVEHYTGLWPLGCSVTVIQKVWVLCHDWGTQTA